MPETFWLWPSEVLSFCPCDLSKMWWPVTFLACAQLETLPTLTLMSWPNNSEHQMSCSQNYLSSHCLLKNTHTRFCLGPIATHGFVMFCTYEDRGTNLCRAEEEERMRIGGKEKERIGKGQSLVWDYFSNKRDQRVLLCIARVSLGPGVSLILPLACTQLCVTQLQMWTFCTIVQ